MSRYWHVSACIYKIQYIWFPLQPSSCKMWIIIVFFFILTAIYSNFSQYLFNHEVSPGLSIAEGSDRDMDSCLDLGWNTCGILKLRLLVKYSKRFSPLLFRDSAIYSCVYMTGGAGSDVPQVQLFHRRWSISKIWSSTKSIRVQIFLMGWWWSLLIFYPLINVKFHTNHAYGK